MSKTRKKWTYQEVFDYFEEHGCFLLSTEFNKQKDILDYICSCNRPSKINFDNFKKGKRCKECKKIKCGEVRRLPYEEVKNRFEENGCKLISESYQNNSELLDFICVCGEPNKISLNSFMSGRLCFECGEIKRIQSMYENGHVTASSQQIHISELTNAQLNYPVSGSFLDMAFLEEKNYIEYDGSGHWMRIKFEKISEKEFVDNERARTYALLRRGWKEIRIISRRDKLPEDRIIQEMIHFAKQYLKSGRHWIHFDVDLGTVKSNQFETKYEYGKLSKLDSKQRYKEVS